MTAAAPIIEEASLRRTHAQVTSRWAAVCPVCVGPERSFARGDMCEAVESLLAHCAVHHPGLRLRMVLDQ